jgi:hypothetical protein
MILLYYSGNKEKVAFFRLNVDFLPNSFLKFMKNLPFFIKESLKKRYRFYHGSGEKCHYGLDTEAEHLIIDKSRYKYMVVLASGSTL